VRATYPFVRITTSTHARLDSRLSYGFVAGPGVHETTVTRPDLFHAYLTEQIGLLIGNHGMPVEIGELSEPIPIHFAYRRDINIEAAPFSSGNSVVDRPLRDVFDTPDLAAMDDAIANGTLQLPPGASEPLALFRAARVDYSCTGSTTTPAPIRNTSRISSSSQTISSMSMSSRSFAASA
jgi:AMP nucleosidase